MPGHAVPRNAAHQQRPRWKPCVGIGLGVLGLTMLTYLILMPLWSRPRALVEQCAVHGWVGWLCPTPHGVYPVILLVALIAAAKLFFGQWPRPIYATVGLAAITVALGLASYAPHACVNGHCNWMLVVIWTLGLFFGVVPGEPGVVDTELTQLPLQFAQLTGMLTLTVVATTIAVAVLRDQIDRRRVRRSPDMDVVAGVDDQALALAKQLIAERAGEPQVPLWYGMTRRERRQFKKRWKRSAVVVLHTNPDEPRLAEFRNLGCRIFTTPTYDAAELRDLALSGACPAIRRWSGAYPAIRRLFAVTDVPRDNISLVRAFGEILSAPGLKAGPFHPRLVALVADPRQAEQFRVDNLDTHSYYVDAISIDELLARDIVARIIEEGRRRVLVLGDSALGVAILDEIVLQRWFCWERSEQCPIREVVVVDEHAEAQVAEWVQHRPPGAWWPELFTPVAEASGDWDEACHRLLGDDPDGTRRLGIDAAIVITGQPSNQLTSQGLRLSGRHENTIVFCPDDKVAGVEPAVGDLADRMIISYGASLLSNGLTPEDSWTVLARQNHAHFLGHDGTQDRAARSPWLDANSPEYCNRARVRKRGIPVGGGTGRLPRFFRDDNLAQQRTVLRYVAQQAKRSSGWVPVTAAHPVAERNGVELSNALLDASHTMAMARQEHERWCRKRLAESWRYEAGFSPDGVPEAELAQRNLEYQQRQEWERCNKNLVDWETGKPLTGGTTPVVDPREISDNNVEQVTAILRRLFWFGIAPAIALGNDAPAKPAVDDGQE